jgi:Macrocin-O-methyltransferase (TylF)
VIQLPDFDRAWDYENDFYLSCDITRISKILAAYELYKMALDLPGHVIECGVFKGASLSRFAMFRSLFGNIYSKKIIAFDVFGKFPETKFEDDVKAREDFIQEAGEQSISVEQMREVLDRRGIGQNVELVSGDITSTVPEYVKNKPELKISLLNLDTDIYEPAVTVLDELFPRIVRGGILILDDYAAFPGETRAVDEYFKDQHVRVQRLPFAMTPCYVVKD